MAPTVNVSTASIADLISQRDELVEALKLADAVFSGAHMDMRVVERKIRAALANVEKQP